jgi:uncharacterized membrane protein YhaH (DUF805 family)
MHWFLDPIQKHYADFDGRIGRQEFWMFVLFCFGINVVLEVIGIELLSFVVSLALLVPSLAMGARRLHDTGKSGWWQLLWLIPVIGWIIIIVFWATDTIPAENQYGAPARPKDVSTANPGAAPAATAPAAVATTAVETPVAETSVGSDSSTAPSSSSNQQ